MAEETLVAGATCGGILLKYKWEGSDLKSQSCSSFALCAAAHTQTKIAAAAADSHTVGASDWPIRALCLFPTGMNATSSFSSLWHQSHELHIHSKMHHGSSHMAAFTANSCWRLEKFMSINQQFISCDDFFPTRNYILKLQQLHFISKK